MRTAKAPLLAPEAIANTQRSLVVSDLSVHTWPARCAALLVPLAEAEVDGRLEGRR